MAPVNHPATALVQNSHDQQVVAGRQQATAKTDGNIQICTWSVNTVYQAGRLADKGSRETETGCVGGV